ncbi:MAG TPA: ATP-binding protein [Chloroflexota bacterium]|nr:ATP-binding protein [Chloroflexota bacterium]
MIVLDLKPVLFIALLLLGLFVGGMITAVTRYRRQKQTGLNVIASPNLNQQLDTAPFGLLIFDHKQTILYQNQMAGRLLTGEALSVLLRDVALIDGRTLAHTRLLTLPEDQTLSWWLCPLEHGALVWLEDLSAQRRLEKSTQLFLNSLSHELRTPLTAVLAHIELLRAPDLPDAIRENSLNQIHQETNRMARLVQDLLTLSRLESAGPPEIRPIDLALLVESVVSDFILIAEEKEILLSLQVESALPPVLADPDRLRQVFINVLDNAVKYGRAGDKITIQLSHVPPHVSVLVQDSGPGIPAHHVPQIATPLYRARTDVPGSGLGLSIAAEIVRQHGGDLQISSSTEGETGTAVTFRLPTPSGN